jgi:hypothetical protein
MLPTSIVKCLKLEMLAIVDRLEKELLPAVESAADGQREREIEFVSWVFNDEIDRLHKLVDATVRMMSS